MGIEKIRAIQWDCEQLIRRFYQSMDNNDYTSIASMFTEDGTWLRQGKELVGGKNIIDALNSRSNTMLIRHVISNQIIDVEDEKNASAVCYITIYHSDTGDAIEKPAKISGPAAFFTYYDTLVYDAGVWKITKKWSTMDFTAA